MSSVVRADCATTATTAVKRTTGTALASRDMARSIRPSGASGQQGSGLRLQPGQTPLELLPRGLETVARRIGLDVERLAHRQRDGAERLGDLRAVPAARRPGVRRLEVEREERVAGGRCQPDRARWR